MDHSMHQPFATGQASLQQINALPHIALEQRGELPVLLISNAHAQAAVALQGAQVLEYIPRDAHPVIWLSEQVEYRHGQSPRGGIPVCWPWFGALERNPAAVRALARGDNLPAHGLARSCDWALHSAGETEEGTELVLRFATDCTPASPWPQPAQLELRIHVGKTLRLALTTYNTGTRPLALTQALHSYFAVSAIDQVHVAGFENSPYIDTLDHWQQRMQHGVIDFSGETDRIYLKAPSCMRLHDRGWNRTIELRTANSASAVVWNPWIEKGRRLSQFAETAWRDMVCIETANVLDDMLELAPQASHTLMLDIGCRS